VGGVSEEPTRRIRSAEQSDGRTPDAGATVEGIPVCGMALTFAGQRRNADLGAVRRRERVSSPLGDAPATTDVQRSPRKGTTSACTLRSACTGRENTEMWLSRVSADDASFARSSDPCTLIATSTPSGQLAEVARWSRYRGRENLGNQEEPAPGSESASVARLAACHRFRKGEGVAGRKKKRKGIKVPVPARIVRAPGSVPVRRSSCRSRQAASGPKYTRQTRTKKCGQGRANGGLGRGERGRSNVCERIERKDDPHLGTSRTTTARDRDKAQGDVRASSSGRNIAKSGEAVAGPGL